MAKAGDRILSEGGYTMSSKFAIAVAITAFVAAESAQAAGPIFASYKGSQQGVTERDTNFNQSLAFLTGIDASGISVSATDVYLSAGSHLYDYTQGGTLLTDMAFADPAVDYTGVSYNSGTVYASYKGSQQGVTIRDLGLNQTSYFNTGIDATGISAGGGHIYLSAGHDLYSYLDNGTLVTDMTFPDTGVLYTGIAYAGSDLFASYGGDQMGVTIRDLALNQTSFFGTPFTANGIAVAPDGSILLASANMLYDYSTSGALLKSFTYPDPGIDYTGIAAGPVPEPATWAVMLVGLGLAGATLRRRRPAALTA